MIIIIIIIIIINNNNDNNDDDSYHNDNDSNNDNKNGLITLNEEKPYQNQEVVFPLLDGLQHNHSIFSSLRRARF